MAVPAEPYAKALANLMHVQAKEQGQLLVQEHQLQAQEQLPQAPASAAAAQAQVGEVFFVQVSCLVFVSCAL